MADKVLTENRPGDERFFLRAGPFGLAHLAEVSGSEVRSAAEGQEDQVSFRGVAPLHVAGPEDVSFLDNRRYLPLLEKTRAGVVILALSFCRQAASTYGGSCLQNALPCMGTHCSALSSRTVIDGCSPSFGLCQ